MKGKKSKLFLGVLAGTLAIALGISTLFSGNASVEAATRFYGVQQIYENISTDDPFVIMELVPDKAKASIGAYVLGSEPTIDSKLLANLDSSSTRRAKVMSLFGTSIVEVDEDKTGTVAPLSYGYNTVYVEQVNVPADLTGWQTIEFAPTINEDGTKTYYSEQRYGTYVEAENGDYTKTTYTETTTPEGSSEAVTTTYDVYTYTPGVGKYNWVENIEVEEEDESEDTGSTEDSEDAITLSYYQVEFETLYYKVEVKSNDWFAEEVLEYDRTSVVDKNIEVVTVTPTEIETNINQGYLADYSGGKIQEWSEVDMLYISNSSFLNMTDADLALLDTYADADISAQTGYNIYEYVLNTSMPVIIDSSLMASATTLDTNMLRLAYLLWDYTSTTTPDSYHYVPTGETEPVYIDVSEWTTAWPEELTNILLTNVAAKQFGTNGSIQGSVYVNQGSNVVTNGLVTDLTSVAFADVTSNGTYATAEALMKGISAVVNEVESENFYNELSGADFTAEYNTTSQQIELTNSSLIKYILNFAYRRATVYKDSITVLDIEPTRYSRLTEDEIRSWLKQADADRIKQINIVQMSTYEFVGTLTDLTAEYDMIYIGDCIGPSGSVGAMNQSSGETTYNDSTMNGLIYTHTGDTYQAPEKFKGLLETEYKKYSNGTKYELTDNNLVTRFSGNDITEEKLEELKEFVVSGYPVVVADKFYTTETVDGKEKIVIDDEYVDNASYLYEFLNYFTETNPKENLMSDNLDDSALLATYINMSKLYLSMVSSPIEYSVRYNNGYIDYVQYLPKTDGKYVLEYVFELADTSAAKLDTVAYEVKAYIDSNADGRHDTTEELDGLVVRETESGTEVNYNELVTGVRYTVTRELPEGYIGMIPWKLEVTQISRNKATTESQVIPVHTSVKGYTAVPADDITKINIIQIKSSSNGGLDLSDNDVFADLFSNVEDKMKYDITINTVTASGFVNAYNNYLKQYNLADNEAGYTAFYNSYFANYDMIMIGFVDMFDDIDSKGATMAIKLFIESGRSVLFSHDTTSFVNAEKSIYEKTAYDFWGYNLNQYIRSIVGMDRYGVTEDSLSFLKNGADLSLVNGTDGTVNANRTAIETANKDFAYSHDLGQKVTDSEVHGYSNGNLVMQNLGVSQKEDLIYGGTGEGDSRVTSISQVNKGQITTYPFDINISSDSDVTEVTKNSVKYQMLNPETLTIKNTHSQYYQLDLRLDKTGDGESDIVVWYCLADGMYDAVPNDVRNNYYIYSAGNIMYTGMGHSGNNVSKDEAKLFVNTMIASFNAGKKDPTIAIVKDAENKGIIKQYSYRTYDTDLGMFDSENEEINFYVNDSNIIHGQKLIDVHYYVEDPTKTSAITTMVGGQTIYLTEIDSSMIASSPETVESNKVCTLELKPELFANAFANKDVGTLKIYISAQTTLDYESAKADEKTSTVFTSITVKARDMFELD